MIPIISVQIIVNLQSTDLVIQNFSNLTDSGILTDGTVNSEQHSNGIVINFLVTRNQLSKSLTDVQSIHIIGSNAQITSTDISGQNPLTPPIHSITVVDICNIDFARLVKVGNGTDAIKASLSCTNSIGEVNDGSAANILSCSVQCSLQISTVAHGNLDISQIAQSSLEDSRLASNRSHSDIVIGIGGGITISGGAASQHGDSHNAGQSQRSNLLEFHSEFFLLMVYKR